MNRAQARYPVLGRVISDGPGARAENPRSAISGS